MDGGAWWATVHGVTKSRTRLSDFTFTLVFQGPLCFHMNCEIFCSSSVKNAIGNFYGSHWSYRLHFVFSQYWFFLLRNMESLSICLCHLWFLSLVSYNFLCTVLLSPSVQFSHVWLFATPWTSACQASLSITNSWSLLKLMSIVLAMPSNHLILCRPLLLLPSIFLSRVFSNESALCIRWPKYWSILGH